MVIERDATKLALELSLAADEFSGLSTKVGEHEQTQAAQQEQLYQTEQTLTAERAQLSEGKLEAERTRSRTGRKFRLRRPAAIQESASGSARLARRCW